MINDETGERESVKTMPESQIEEFFISRAGEDKDVAVLIRQILRDAGHKTFMQDDDFGHTSFIDRMAEGFAKVDRGARVVALLSRRYMEKVHCLKEARYPLIDDPSNKRERLIVLRIDECAPSDFLKDIPYVDLCPVLHDANSIAIRLLESITPTIERNERSFGGRIESSDLKSKKSEARRASRLHKTELAMALWTEAGQMAEQERNKGSAIVARLEVMNQMLRAGAKPSEILAITDRCLADAVDADLGPDRCHALQLAGEFYRLNSDMDRARGYIKQALDISRIQRRKIDEGYALLSQSALQAEDKTQGANDLELIALAYDAFSSALATGDADLRDSARRGFAICHRWRADKIGYVDPDEAAAELTRAINIYEEAGNDYEWDLADSLLARAKLSASVMEFRQASRDLAKAEELFLQLDRPDDQARCILQAAELLDAGGRRDASLPFFEEAAEIASRGNNERKAAWYIYRHAQKLIELGDTASGEQKLLSLLDGGWLDDERRLDISVNLCLVAKAIDDDSKLQAYCAAALNIIDTLAHNSVDPNERRRFLLRKAQILSDLGQNDDAMRFLKQAIKRFESSGDDVGVIECWFQIRGLMQGKDDAKEREACETVLRLGAEKKMPMLASMALLGLAQLNLKDNRRDVAMDQLGRAEELDPMNPVLAIVGKDLRLRYPKRDE